MTDDDRLQQSYEDRVRALNRVVEQRERELLIAAMRRIHQLF